MKINIGRKRIVIARQVTFSKRCIGRFKKESELCTLCGAYVVVVIFSSSNKVYSCGHPSAEFIVDKFLGENQPGFDAPNSTSLSRQNVNLDEINNELNMLENSLEQQKKHGKALQGLREELPYERLNFSDLKKLIELLEASQLMEYYMEFPYQTIGMCLSPLRVDANSSSNFSEASSGSNE
uniref:MADS-box domain-containing protein n=1 Tax=Solanum lycopersicum TaxID=4081 RepID=A0A3Q7H6P3_SOLLC